MKPIAMAASTKGMTATAKHWIPETPGHCTGVYCALTRIALGFALLPPSPLSSAARTGTIHSGSLRHGSLHGGCQYRSRWTNNGCVDAMRGTPLNGRPFVEPFSPT